MKNWKREKRKVFTRRMVTRLLLTITGLIIAVVAGPAGSTQCSPSAIYQPDQDRVSVFAIAQFDGNPNDYILLGKTWAPGQSWEWFGRGPGFQEMPATSPSAVVPVNSPRHVIFSISTGGHLQDTYYDPKIGYVFEDQGLPGVPLRDDIPSVVYQTKLDRVIVFVVGQNGHLYDKFWDGTQWKWEDQGMPPGASQVFEPSAVYQAAADRVVVFVNTSGSGHLWDKYWNGRAWVWEDQGLPPGANAFLYPRAIYQPTLDRVVVFVESLATNSANRFIHLADKYWNGQQWVWEDQGTPANLDMSPAGVVYQPTLDRIAAFVTMNDGNLYDVHWDGQQQQWIWDALGKPGAAVGCSPGVAYQSTLDRIFVFVAGSDGHLYDTYWNGQQWVWEDQGLPNNVAPCFLDCKLGQR